MYHISNHSEMCIALAVLGINLCFSSIFMYTESPESTDINTIWIWAERDKSPNKVQKTSEGSMTPCKQLQQLHFAFNRWDFLSLQHTFYRLEVSRSLSYHKNIILDEASRCNIKRCSWTFASGHC